MPRTHALSPLSPLSPQLDPPSLGRRKPKGHTLVELTVVLTLFAIAATLAAPPLRQWWWRARVEGTARDWVADLQTARLQALKQGQAMRLQRLEDCQPSLALGDWRCGWVVLPDTVGGAPVWQNNLQGDLSLQLYPAMNQLPLNAQGDTAFGGLRLTVLPRAFTLSAAQNATLSVCVNNAGRTRLVKASTCSG